jgi:hypothetical protein
MGKQSRRNVQPSTHFTRSLRDGRRHGARALRVAQMDIDALHSALLSFTLLAGKLRLAREKRPESEWTRCDFEQFLNELDRDLSIPTAMLAGELGFAVCRCCWPPEVLATDLAGHITSLGGADLASGEPPKPGDKPV